MDWLYSAQLLLRKPSIKELGTVYQDWLAGQGEFAGLRNRRLNSGFGSRWLFNAWDGQLDLRGEFDCQASLRRDEGSFLLRFIHRDAKQGAVMLHNFVRVRGVETGELVLEHAVGRSAPRDVVLEPFTASPTVLRHIIGQFGASVEPKELCRGKATSLKTDEVEGFVRYVLLDHGRATPVVVVAPEKDDGHLLIDPNKLAVSLTGMALVAALGDRSAPFVLTDVLSKAGFEKTFSCFDGGLRVYEARLEPGQSPYQHQLWTRKRIEAVPVGRRQDVVAGEVASRIVTRTRAWDLPFIIESFDKLKDRRASESLLRLVREQLVSESWSKSGPVGSLAKKVAEEQKAAVAELESKLAAAVAAQDYFDTEHRKAVADADAARESANRLQRERDDKSLFIEDLQARMDGMKRQRAEAGLSPEQRGAFDAVLNARGTLEEVLTVLAATYPTRLDILESAWKAARESREFKYVEQALDLLLMLATSYWEARNAGQPDATASGVFGAAYAMGEGEKEKNKVCRERRTFSYLGEAAVMFQHLKVGVKDSVYETWRAHFIWDGKAKRVVLGHCGRHLDHT